MSEKSKQYMKKYRDTHKEKFKSYREKSKKSLKERYRMLNQPYRTSYQAFMPDLIARDGKKCRACGTQEQLTVNHIIPVNAEGSNDLSNLEILCRPCNIKEYHILVKKALKAFFQNN